MPELAQITNKETSNDRLLTYSGAAQTTRSSATLAQASTGNAWVLLPFWNGYTLEESKKWWLPERASSAILDLSLWGGSLQRMALSSWFSVQTLVLTTVIPESSQKICSPSSWCLWHDIMDYALLQTARGDEMQSRKARTPKGVSKKENVPPPTAEGNEKLSKRTKTSKKKEETKIPVAKVQCVHLFPTLEE